MMGSQGQQQTGKAPYYPCPHMMGGGMMGYGMGQGMMGYCNKEEFNKFLDETIDSRKELHNKRFEYSEALRNPKTKPETITNYENEIHELQKKIYEKSPQ
ncbi:MAG: hypothetical protein KAI96_04740 [Thermodesulfovibrionia bacterium]|nr:hypothetical protein [Thermodesulfovibrionia bacterium]